MKNNRLSTVAWPLLAAVAVSMMAACETAPVPGAEAAPTAGDGGVQLSALEVTFKLDPRLTRGVYMGDRWVSPATYTRVQEPGKDLVVDARAEGRGLQGETVQVSPAWTSSDPDVLYVVPTKGAAVEIHVLGEGTSDLSVAGNGASRQYQVNVTRQIEALRVDIVRK